MRSGAFSICGRVQAGDIVCMNVAEILGDTWAWVYYGLLAFNVLVALTCLVVGPRPWTLPLCDITTHLAALLFGAAFAASGLVHDLGIPLGLYLALLLPLLGETLVLWAISRWRLHDRSRPAFLDWNWG
jgi:hypothetical protein